jgi:lipoprotein-anchoring transpeptidase ErfK/SrfK
MWARVIGAVALLAVASGCSGTRPHSGTAPPPPRSTESTSAPAGAGPADTSLVAEPSGPTVDLYATVGAAQPLLVLPNPWLLNGVSDQPIPQALLVLDTTSAGWIQVQLPERPNGSTGWLAPGTAHLLRDGYRIQVTLHLHTITVLKDGSTIYAGPVATGAPVTPTPVGLFYIRVLLHTTEPSSIYGPYAYGLSAHSEALTTFDGGDAEIGIHGNDDASVLGQSVTHGCVRMDNTEISQLAAVLPLGTPVQITA